MTKKLNPRHRDLLNKLKEVYHSKQTNRAELAAAGHALYRELERDGFKPKHSTEVLENRKPLKPADRQFYEAAHAAKELIDFTELQPWE